MLPDGFEWRTWCNGPALTFGGQLVAMISAIPAGVRVELNVGTNHLRHEFFDDESTGVRYCEAWANKWQDRIREEHTGRAVNHWAPPVLRKEIPSHAAGDA
jgi:hypothetical protein